MCRCTKKYERNEVEPLHRDRRTETVMPRGRTQKKGSVSQQLTTDGPGHKIVQSVEQWRSRDVHLSCPQFIRVKLQSFVKWMPLLTQVPASVWPEQTKCYSLYLWDESTQACNCQISMEQTHFFKQWHSRTGARNIDNSAARTHA